MTRVSYGPISPRRFWTTTRTVSQAQRANCNDAASVMTCNGFEETFLDRNGNNRFDRNDSPAASAGSSLPNGQYNGTLCRLQDEAEGICSRDLVDVRDSLVLVNGFSDAEQYELLLINQFSRSATSLLVENSFYNVYISDKFNNPPPAGSTIDFEGSGDCEPVTESQPVPDNNKAGAFASSLSCRPRTSTISRKRKARI